MKISILWIFSFDKYYYRWELGFEVEVVGLDAGYNIAAICKGLADRNIFRVIAYRPFTAESSKAAFLMRMDFKYQENSLCPIKTMQMAKRISPGSGNGEAARPAIFSYIYGVFFIS